MTAYDGPRDHLRDQLRRLDLLVGRYLADWRGERGGAGDGGGLYVSDTKVDRLLRADPLVGAGRDGADAPTDGAVGAPEALGSRDGVAVGHSGGTDTAAGPSEDGTVDQRLHSLTETIRRREQETLKAGIDLPLVQVAERFGLSRRHVDVVLVALAPELDLKYETVYAYLQDDIRRKRPTVGLALRIVGGAVGSEADGRSLFTPGEPLLTHRLVRVAGGEDSLLSQPVTVDRRLVGFLLGETVLDETLHDVARRVDTAQALPRLTAPGTDGTTSPLERLPVDPSARERLAALSDRLDDEPRPIIHLHGPYGSGRDSAAAALAASAGRPLVAAEADRLPADDFRETLALVEREVLLCDGVVHVRNLPPPARGSEESWALGLDTLLDRLDGFDCPVFLSGEASLPARVGAQLAHHELVTVAFERPGFALRRAFWEQVDLPGDPAELASKFEFTAGQVEDAATTARTLALGEPTVDDVYEACRAQSRERLEELARQIEPTYGWEDIVLPARETRQLREVAAHIEHQGTVYSEWGFEERFSLGTGVNVLFAGPSGTGKTMAAEILAGEAGLDLYKVDLASIVSKYIGETESNLGRVFDEAEASNALLFFDEADALFGQRSEVSDAHDRYANVEVDYLLERMEEHDSVVLLATNLEENMDDAFQRRLNVTVEFPLPDRDARERIWRGVFPEATPVEELDWQFLAGFDLTGGDIKNAALTAAFLAADDGSETVGMQHAVRALWRELQKSDRLVSRGDFGGYVGYLP